jgi:hypothetical protein
MGDSREGDIHDDLFVDRKIGGSGEGDILSASYYGRMILDPDPGNFGDGDEAGLFSAMWFPPFPTRPASPVRRRCPGTGTGP